MDKVFEKTRELADAIMQSEVYQKMRTAEELAMKNPLASSIMSEYLETKKSIEELLQEQDPDPAALKALSTQMDSCQERLQMLDEIGDLTRSREDFGNLIGQVNKLLRFIITGQMDEGSGCSGSCSSCSGCTH